MALGFSTEDKEISNVERENTNPDTTVTTIATKSHVRSAKALQIKDVEWLHKKENKYSKLKFANNECRVDPLPASINTL